MKEAMKETTKETTEIQDTLVKNTILGFKKVLVEHLDEGFRFEQEFKDSAIAMRFITGISPSERTWFEVIFVEVEKLDKDKYNEILMNVHDWKPFRYHHYYDRLFGRIVYIVPKEIKGVFPPKLVVKKSYVDVRTVKKFERTLYVVLNTKMQKEKVIASALAYLVNYFVNRVVALESAIFKVKRRKINVWDRVRMIFRGIVNGSQAKLSRSLYLLYNSIYYRVESLEEQRRVSEYLVKTVKLLADLFFIFAKAFDKYASKVYAWVVSTQFYKTIKDKVGFRNVPVFCENVLEIWRMANEFIARNEVEKILNAKPVLN